MLINKKVRLVHILRHLHRNYKLQLDLGTRSCCNELGRVAILKRCITSPCRRGVMVKLTRLRFYLAILYILDNHSLGQWQKHSLRQLLISVM